MENKPQGFFKSLINNELLLFKVFREPRPKYIAKVTAMDKVINVLFLWAFPKSVKPNQVTVFRFISIPFIIFFLIFSFYKIAFVLFVISALSDAIDGGLARTRNQITDWGIVFDPFADKLLIGSVGGILVFKFLSPILALLIVFLEVVLTASAYYRFKGEIVPAKTVGKIKMVLQCIGVGLIFLALVSGRPEILILAVYTLYAAVFFAFLSILVYRSI